MTLDEIHQLIANSDKSDWNRIGAPLYNGWIDYSSDGFEGAHTHNERAVYQTDVDIAMSGGRRETRRIGKSISRARRTPYSPIPPLTPIVQTSSTAAPSSTGT